MASLPRPIYAPPSRAAALRAYPGRTPGPAPSSRAARSRTTPLTRPRLASRCTDALIGVDCRAARGRRRGRAGARSYGSRRLLRGPRDALRSRPLPLTRRAGERARIIWGGGTKAAPTRCVRWQGGMKATPGSAREDVDNDPALAKFEALSPRLLSYVRPGEPFVAAPPTKVGPWREPGGRGSTWRRSSTKRLQVRSPLAHSFAFCHYILVESRDLSPA